MRLPIAYCLAIVGAELITVFWHPLLGMLFYALLLAALLLHSALLSHHPVHRLLLSLTLAPMTRMISLSLPLLPFPRAYWYLLIYAPLVTAAFVLIRTLRLPWGEVGLVIRRLPLQLAIATTGIAFGAVEYLILKPDSPAAEFSWGAAWLPALFFMLGTGFGEELIFRGVLQRTSQEIFGKWGLVLVSLLFGILHIGYLSVADVIFVTAAGLFFAFLVYKTGSLLGVSLSHGLTNVVLYLVIPFFGSVTLPF